MAVRQAHHNAAKAKARNVTTSLDDILELLLEMRNHLAADAKASGNTPITQELERAIKINSLFGRVTDRMVDDTTPTPVKTKTITRKA